LRRLTKEKSVGGEKEIGKAERKKKDEVGSCWVFRLIP